MRIMQLDAFLRIFKDIKKAPEGAFLFKITWLF